MIHGVNMTQAAAAEKLSIFALMIANAYIVPLAHCARVMVMKLLAVSSVYGWRAQDIHGFSSVIDS